jgi:hypothetical protein
VNWFTPKPKTTNGCVTPTNGEAIVVDHITKRYGDFTAVDDVSFAVKQREIFGLLGPNGAGKSTLIRMMTTLLPITKGRAIINGFDVAKDPDDARQCMGVIPQAMTSDIDLTAEENLSIYAKLYGMPLESERRASMSCWKRSTSPSGGTLKPGPSPAACGVGSRSRAGWSTTRASSFSMSPPLVSTRSRVWPCGRC